MTPRERAVERVARLESLSHAQAVELVDDVLAAIGHDALRAERDRLRMSNMYVGGRQLTWPEAQEHWRELHQREVRLSTVLADLDRCEHGRHEGDVCSECGGPSRGNPKVRPGQVIGYGLDAEPIAMPVDPRVRRKADAWRLTRPSSDPAAAGDGGTP